MNLAVLCGCSGLRSGKANEEDVAAFLSVPGDVWLRTELYFGTSKPDGEITEGEWRRFMTDEVSPRFPEGLTVLRGDGQWKDPSGQIYREGSHLLILLHPPDPAAEKRIEEIRKIYCARYRQASVLRVTSRARVSFYSPTNSLAH